MTKDQRTIKQLTAQVTELKATLTSAEDNLKRTQEYRERSDNELADIHRTFDLLGVPKRVKNQYHDLSANARLTLFIAQTNGIPVAQPDEEE